MKELLLKAKTLIDKLNFDECIEAYNNLEAGNPVIDLVFDRMEALDPERFENWL